MSIEIRELIIRAILTGDDSGDGGGVNKEEIIVRRLNSLEEGQLFIKNRLEVYENMWNGCGCKVDYYK